MQYILMCVLFVDHMMIRNNPDDIQKADVLTLLHTIGIDIKRHIDINLLENRSRFLNKSGLGIADAMHLAHAEQVNARFVTCDDKIVKKYRMMSNIIWCGTPLEFCEKEGLL